MTRRGGRGGGDFPVLSIFLIAQGRARAEPTHDNSVQRSSRSEFYWVSFINLIERPRVGETRVPHFVDHFCRLHVVLTARAVHHRQDSSSADAALELLREGPVPIREGLASPPALAAQHGRSDLVQVTTQVISHIHSLYAHTHTHTHTHALSLSPFHPNHRDP